MVVGGKTARGIVWYRTDDDRLDVETRIGRFRSTQLQSSLMPQLPIRVLFATLLGVGIAGPVRGDDEFKPRTLIPRPFPAITKFPVVSVGKAAGKINDAELVLGVVVNNKARAYPINMLTGPRREILNDVLGGRAIAATW